MDEDVITIDDMLPTTISEGGNRYYSYDGFAFFDMWEEQRTRKADKKEQCTNVTLSKPPIFLSEVYL